MWTQPWGNAPIRWGGFSRRPSEGRNTYTVRNFFAEAWERCLRPGRLAQGIDDMPAAIAREPKPMAVSMEGVGTRGSREDPQERLGLVHAAEHITTGSRKLQIALRCPDLRLELRGKWRHHPHGVEGNLPDVFEELDAYARLSHISSRWRMAARRAAAPRSRSLAIPHRACRGDGTLPRPGSRIARAAPGWPCSRESSATRSSRIPARRRRCRARRAPRVPLRSIEHPSPRTPNARPLRRKRADSGRDLRSPRRQLYRLAPR